MKSLFDFSGVVVGQGLTRIIYNLWINEAIITEINEDEIHCLVIIDGGCTMIFDRKTGVNRKGENFGLVINRSGEGKEYVEKLKEDLRACLREATLHPQTMSALKLQMSHDW